MIEGEDDDDDDMSRLRARPTSGRGEGLQQHQNKKSKSWKVLEGRASGRGRQGRPNAGRVDTTRKVLEAARRFP
jgi:hypothetical protein